MILIHRNEIIVRTEISLTHISKARTKRRRRRRRRMKEEEEIPINIKHRMRTWNIFNLRINRTTLYILISTIQYNNKYMLAFFSILKAETWDVFEVQSCPFIHLESISMNCNCQYGNGNGKIWIVNMIKF